MKRLFALLLCLMMISGTGARAEYTLKDQAERVVTLKKVPERIVSGYYISTSTLLALGCGDRLVGIEKKADTRPLYRYAAPALLNLPAVGNAKELNLETVIALAPDLVILPLQMETAADQLTEIGIPTLLVHPENEVSFAECVLLIGQACGREEVAEQLLEMYITVNDQLFSRLPREYKEIYIAGPDSVLTAYPGGMYQSTLAMNAGAYNVSSCINGIAKTPIDPEQLLNWDPEYIFIVAGAAYTARDVLQDERLSTLRAVQNGRVYAMPDGLEAWDYPTVSCVLGQVYLAHVLYPEIFSRQELIQTAIRFYREIFGIEANEEMLDLARVK